MIDTVDVNEHDGFALRYTADSGHLEIIKFPIQNGVDYHRYGKEAVVFAAGNGHKDVVDYFIDVAPEIVTWKAYVRATDEKHTDIAIKLLCILIT